MPSGLTPCQWSRAFLLALSEVGKALAINWKWENGVPLRLITI